MPADTLVNGKHYTLWQQFVDRKDEFIGGRLVETCMDSMCVACGETAETLITDIELLPNGKDSAFFRIVGEKFRCGFDVQYGGVSGSHSKNDGGIPFHSQYGDPFWIYPKIPL
jgi:hypothetical protein